MLYGNLIFIKKTGGDGSKFPVTEKDIKIGRSEDCLIRIYNPQVEPEHCQLIIEDSGQATLRNLSNQTILNGKPLDQGDTALSHGDVFKIGARSARWEYLPSSNNYRQLLSPTGQTGRLVAVVMPQQRSSGDQATPGTSSQVSVLKNVPLGKRMSSEKASESSSAVKIRKSSSSDLITKNKGDFLKILTSRHSLKSTKLLLPGTKIKDRKSISGMTSTKAIEKAKVKSRKSTLPSWKVKVVSPPARKSVNRNSLTKSVGRKSPKSAVKTPLKNVESKSEKLLLLASKSEVKTPQRTLVESNSTEKVVKSTSKSVLKGGVKIILESSSKKNESFVRSTQNLSKSPSPKKRSIKSPSKAVFSTPRQKHPRLSRPMHSESKLNSSTARRRMNLILHDLDSSQETEESSSINSSGEICESSSRMSAVTNVINEAFPVKQTARKSEKATPAKTPGKTVKSPRKSSVKKSGRSPGEIQKKTPRKSVNVKTSGNLTPRQSKISRESRQTCPIVTDDASSAKRGKHIPRKSVSANNTPAKNVRSAAKSPSSTNQKLSVTPVTPSASDLESGQTATSTRSRKSSPSKRVSKKSTKPSASPRGVRRKLSPASNAERAAKKLKTSSPKKPDKNKKAALLVLGIASRNQLLSQNLKVLLKRKIVKKAIKQSTAVAALKDARKKKTLPKTSRGKISKPTKTSTKGKKVVKSSPPQSSKTTPLKYPAHEKTPTTTSKSKKALETSQLNSTPQASLNLPLQSEKSPSKPNKNSEVSGPSNLFKSYTSETPSLHGSFEKIPENYLFSSNRRCSKRLSSKNETGRPDFIELCPTALGLIPKNLEIFKTPKVNKRRSLSLATPKNVQSSVIVKSASTSKIGNRKSVRLSSKDASFNSGIYSPNVPEDAQYDFTPFQSPDITVDVFVSPLTDKGSVTKKDMNQSAVKAEEIFKTSTKSSRSSADPTTCVRRLLQSPQPEKSSETVSSSQLVLSRSSRITASQSPSPAKVITQSSTFSKSGKNSNLNDFEGVRKLFTTPKVQKSIKNRLSDLEGVSRLLRSPRDAKSPKNDLTDVKGVKKLFQTPKVQNTPKNDLTDVRGVKRLMKTPELQKSPRNDLSDVRGVKKLLTTPKVQKGPKNDLSDLEGVKQLFRTPRLQKSPKNELTDLRGVKDLLGSPKVQKSPKNDLSDITGVQKLFATPRVRKSLKNNLLDVSGVENLFQSPVIQELSRMSAEDAMELTKSLKLEESFSENLTNLSGVKQLLISRGSESGSKNKKMVSQKSHVKDFKAIRGRRTIKSTPKGPKNDLSDLTGVRELFYRHKPTCNYDMDLTGVAELFELPEIKAAAKRRMSSSDKETVSENLGKRPKAVRCKEKLESGDEEETKITTRGSRSRKATTEKQAQKATRSRKSEVAGTDEKKPSKRKAADEIKTTKAKRPSVKNPQKGETETKTKSRTRTKSEATANETEKIKDSRKRKAQVENSETSPPKLRRKPTAVKTSSSAAKLVSSRRTRSETVSKKTTSVRSVKKAPPKVRTSSKVQSKTTVKTSTKKVQKVQNRSQTSSRKRVSDSEKKVSPKKTRSVAASRAVARKASKTQSESEKSAAAGRKKASPVTRRSTRRK